MANDGKKSEELIRVMLKSYQETESAYFNRLYDSTTAKGGFVPPQAGDFMGMFEGTGYVIEVKSSERRTTMLEVPRSYIRDSQIIGPRLYIRAGGSGLFIFHSLATDTFELFDSKDIVKWWLGKGKLSTKMILARAKGKAAFKKKLLSYFKAVVIL